MKRIAIYLAVTFGLTWGLLIPAGINLGTFENGVAASPVMMGLVAVSMFFPLVGAFAANLASKPEERIDLGLKPQITRNIRYYLAAWFTPIAVSLLGVIVFFAFNPQWFDPTMESYVETTAVASGTSIEQLTDTMPSMPLIVAATLLSSITAPLINMIPAFGEEVGWRGMLFPTLAEHTSERAAVLLSGVIWGLWHAPVIAMGHNYGMEYAGFPFVGILVMTLSCTAYGSLLSYLRLRTGSVWPCALAHGALNAIANFGILFCAVGSTPFGPSPLGLVAGIPMIILGIVCWRRLSTPQADARRCSHR